MASKTLGKRTRSATDSEETQAILTRAKRRLVVPSSNDENENPFVRPDNEIKQDEMEVDEPTKGRPKRSVISKTVPAKHGRSESRVALSPSKVNAHFKVGKSVVQVFEDGKEKEEKARAAPTTPRHRDSIAAAKKVPITPRHRVLVAGSRLTPTSRPKTPVTPSQSVYHPVRQLFSRCCAPGRLVGREQERDELTTFINTRLEDYSSAGCLYISGPPGTGKSALVSEVSRQLEGKENTGMSVVNCMSVRNAKDLSNKLSEDLGLVEDAGFEYLRKCFQSNGQDQKKFVVILDEVDRLVDMDLALLYGLFEWSMQKTSSLILIGIANALDLTDRFLPRLKSRGLKPELLPFMPYTAAQIAEVLTSKLKSLVSTEDDKSPLPFLHPAAIQFCAKKVASQTGDLRKAFDICRRAIDLVDLETREQAAEAALQNSPSRTPLVENINLSSPPTPRSSPKSPAKQGNNTSYTAATAPKATIAHVAKVTAQVFGNGTTQRLSTLNLQQKAVLCALASLERKARDSTIFATPSSSSQKDKNLASAPTVKALYETYTSLCSRENLLHPLSSIEFRDVVSGLETLSLVSRVDGSTAGVGLGSFAAPMTPSRTPGRKSKKNGFFGNAIVGGGADERRVASAFGEKELRASLEGAAGGELLREMLEG